MTRYSARPTGRVLASVAALMVAVVSVGSVAFAAVSGEASSQEAYCYIHQQVDGSNYGPDGSEDFLARTATSEMWFSNDGAGAVRQDGGSMSTFAPGERFYTLPGLPADAAGIGEWLEQFVITPEEADGVELIRRVGETLTSSFEFCDGGELLEGLATHPSVSARTNGSTVTISAEDLSTDDHPAEYRLLFDTQTNAVLSYEVRALRDGRLILRESVTILDHGAVDAVGERP